MCMCMHMCTHALVRAHEMHAGTQESPVHAHVPRARDMPRGARASLCQARAPAHPLRRSQAIFRELDIDRSGKLSYAEMRTCMRPEVRGAESRTEGAAAADDGGGARPRRATIMIDARMPKLPRELEHRARDILSLHAQVRRECAAPPTCPQSQSTHARMHEGKATQWPMQLHARSASLWSSTVPGASRGDWNSPPLRPLFNRLRASSLSNGTSSELGTPTRHR